MEKTGKLIIGIDIGQHSIKAVKLQKSEKEIRILDFVIKEKVSGESSAEADVLALKDVLNELGTEGAQVYSVVSGQDIVVKHSVVPFMPKEELRDAVRWSLKETVNFNLDESKIDFKILGSITGSDGIKRNEVMAVAVGNGLIDSHIKLLQGAGIEPRLITISHFALANIIEQDKKLMAGKINAVIDIGLKKTTILIFKGTSLQFIRKISTASESFTNALSGVVVTFPKKIELDSNKAEAIKRKCGIPAKNELSSTYEDIPLTQISVLLRPVLERFLTDIRGSLRYFREEFKVDTIDQIFLVGAGAMLKNLVDFVRDGLGGIKTQLITVGGNITSQVPQSKDLSLILPALGASIGVCLAKDDAINLVPKSIKIQKTIGIQQMILRVAVPFLSILMLFGFISMKLQERRHQKILSSYNDYYSNLVKLRSLRDNIVERQRFFNEIIGAEPNLFLYLKELSRILPKSIVLGYLKLEKEDRLFVIEGFAYTSGMSAENYLADFLLNLENSPYFNNVNLLLSKKEKEKESQLELVSFQLSVNLAEVEWTPQN